MTTPTGPTYDYRAKVRRVVDGDTIVADVDLGFRVSAAITIRIKGVNAPEIATAEGKTAELWLEQLLHERKLLVRSYKDRQSFARWVCDVWWEDEGAWESVAEALIKHGHGVVA